MPEPIMIDVDAFVKVCAAFTAVCVAGGWIWKLTRPLRKPIEDVQGELGEIDKRSKVCADMFANDKKILEMHEQLLSKQGSQINALSEDIKQLLQNDLLTLAHIETGNNTGDIAARRKELESYIVRNR